MFSLQQQYLLKVKILTTRTSNGNSIYQPIVTDFITQLGKDRSAFIYNRDSYKPISVVYNAVTGINRVVYECTEPVFVSPLSDISSIYNGYRYFMGFWKAFEDVKHR